jgi:polyhydroxyalkanoate synthesis regulator phasin
MADKKAKRGDAVRQAVDEAFQAAAGQAQFTRERAQDLVDDLSGAAGRLRDVLEELRPAGTDDVRELRTEVRALAERVGRLEATLTEKPKRAPRARTGAARAPKKQP